mgnify:CR=1 FL=1
MYRSHVLVCGGTGCTSSGSQRILDTLKKEIEKAKREQVTADVIKRAIEKAKGANLESYDSMVLEGFGPGNSMFVIECLTDNHNRTCLLYTSPSPRDA